MRTHSLFDIDDDAIAQRSYLRRFSLLVTFNGALYVLWGIVQRWVSPQAIELPWERPLLYALFSAVVLLANAAPIRHEWRLRLIATNRWIYFAHYISLVARNHVQATYALPVFFLTFFFASAFERPRDFFLFALYAVGLSFFCLSEDPEISTMYFRSLMAVSLLSSYFVMLNRYRLLESSRKTEQLLRDVFSSSSVGLALLDTRGTIITANQALARLLGSGTEALRNQRLAAQAKNEGTELTEALAMVAGGRSLHVAAEIPFRERSGLTPWGRVSLTLIPRSQHSPLVLALVEDVTAQREAELLVRDRQEKMLHSARMAALGEMAGGIAHEINNPLAVIDLSARVLTERIFRQAAPPELIAESLASIQTMIGRITRIISGLRRFSRESSQDEIETCSLLDVANETLSLCEESLRLKKIDLALEIPADLAVRCRNVETSQVILNVLNNAVDAMKEAGVRKISLTAQRAEPGFVTLHISNTGVPVPPEIAEKIFQPFFTTKPIGQGVGLGLSISLGAMSAQGGNLSLERRHDETCFVLQFREAGARVD